MKSLAIFSFLLIFISNHKVAQSAECQFTDQEEIHIGGYTCKLSVTDGESNITSINGSHDDDWYDDASDESVLVVAKDNSLSIKVVPSIICEKFINLKAIWLNNVDIEEIHENSLINCNNLVYLDIPNNKIKKLPANVFASQSELDILYLYGNLIEELPANVFAPLKKLRLLSLNNNKLKTLDSAAFGDDHLEFHEFYFYYNQLTSFDERIIDNNQALDVMDGSSNPCTEGYFNDKLRGRSKIKSALKKCFENYVESDNQVKTVKSDELMMTTEEDTAVTTEENNEQTTTTDENNAEDFQMFFQSLATLMNAFGEAFNETENQERSNDESQVTTAIPDETVERSTAEELTVSNENIKSINEKVNVLMEELNKTTEEIQSLKSENEAIKEEKNKLTTDIQNMQQKNQVFNTIIIALMNSNDELKADNEEIHKNIQLLIDEVKKLTNNEPLKDVKDDIDSAIG